MSKIPEIRADKGDVIGIGVDGSGNIIGKNINVVINQVRGYGLALLKSTHFNENSYTDPNFDDWKNGFNLTLESIFYKREYRRESILEEIRNRLEKQGRLLLAWRIRIVKNYYTYGARFVIILTRVTRFCIAKEMRNQKILQQLRNS